MIGTPMQLIRTLAAAQYYGDELTEFDSDDPAEFANNLIAEARRILTKQPEERIIVVYVEGGLVQGASANFPDDDTRLIVRDHDRDADQENYAFEEFIAFGDPATIARALAEMEQD
ncbi:hypothetical protein [Oceanidesulfovibrio marinus]|uniref:Uncharacterized protein n=1 Tax=Oceanidesulfovibrio marinus TaxID=370038 RepID=A0A6P1ZD60_9BACT|nr:hypothetical protein [Oceanidesulfovibrio marinus]TVM31186.1 hypothetical protein DQK91_18930 [Oceanidesulfovibrio marinus]